MTELTTPPSPTSRVAKTTPSVSLYVGAGVGGGALFVGVLIAGKAESLMFTLLPLFRLLVVVF